MLFPLCRELTRSVLFPIIGRLHRQVIPAAAEFDWHFAGRRIMEEKKMISYEGLRELEEELQDRKVNRRREIADAIKVAREQGDLSENAEYDAAKDEQRDNEARIEEIENILKSVEVVDETDIDTKKVSIGSLVKIRDVEFNEDMEFLIVGPTEANSLENKIANDSPLGAALMGKERNNKITVTTPGGEVVYKILSVKRNRK